MCSEALDASSSGERPGDAPDVAVARCAADDSPNAPMELDDVETPLTAAQVTQRQNEQRRERHWRRMVRGELRERLVTTMTQELKRVTGSADVRHLRMCAARYESFVWKKSATQAQYRQKLERRIESLRRQESGGEEVQVSAERLLGASPEPKQAADATPAPLCPFSTPQPACPLLANVRRHSHSSGRRSSSKRSGKRKMRASSAPSSSSTDGASAQRDEMYFSKLRIMKTKYRDEVALVFRELCRVNTVIQHSASLRRHESNNLGDFLANLKKIIYLLEQQPGEACGMIPARKRTVEYLDVVESHIQRKVLPILHRLRHTYSTILRPIVLNYMRNSYRFNRRF